MNLQREIFDSPFRLVDMLILASLSRESRYGYELQAHVRNMSLGRVVEGNATVYKAVKRLVADGLVKALDKDPRERRQYYDITPAGRSQLHRDLVLLRWVLRAFETTSIVGSKL